METTLLTVLIFVAVTLSVIGIYKSIRNTRDLKKQLHSEPEDSLDNDVYSTTIDILEGRNKNSMFEKYCYLKTGIALFEQLEMFEVCSRIHKLLDTPEMKEIEENFTEYFANFDKIV